MGWSANSNVHIFEEVGDTCEDISLLHAGAAIVDAWGVDDHDTFSADGGLDDSDLASARLHTPTNSLLLRSDEIDELYRREETRRSQNRCPMSMLPQLTVDLPVPDCPIMLHTTQFPCRK